MQPLRLRLFGNPRLKATYMPWPPPRGSGCSTRLEPFEPEEMGDGVVCCEQTSCAPFPSSELARAYLFLGRLERKRREGGTCLRVSSATRAEGSSLRPGLLVLRALAAGDGALGSLQLQL